VNKRIAAFGKAGKLKVGSREVKGWGQFTGKENAPPRRRAAKKRDM
jgi:hypothetical protein